MPSPDSPTSVENLEKLLKGFVLATLELAALRHDLCLEDSPPMVVEQVSEIAEDTWNALRGIDTCSEEPCEEYTALCDHVKSLARELLEMKKRVQWISVETELPPDNFPVLVHGGIAVHYTDSGWWTRMENPERKIQWEVTHWRPLPLPPRERQPKEGTE